MYSPSITSLDQSSSLFPAHISALLGDTGLKTIRAIGNLKILKKGRLLAFFCSKRSPGKAILHTYDWIRRFRDDGLAIAGGFHSPMEKEALDLLLRGIQPIIICPARGIEQMRLPVAWRKPLETGRILVLSPFENKHRRVTAGLAEQRNEFVAALADDIFIAHAEPDSKSLSLAQKSAAWGKTIYTLQGTKKTPLTALGAVPIDRYPFLKR